MWFPELKSDSGKSKVRTIRINKWLDEVLEAEAKEQNISVNTLVNLVLTKYIQWDRNVEKMGYVSLSPEMLRDFVSAIDDDEISEIGKRHGTYHRGLVSHCFGEANLDSYLKWYPFWGKYSRLYSYSCKSDGRSFTLVHEHDFGPKMSIYQRSFEEVGLRDIGIRPESEISGRTVTIRFNLTEKNQSQPNPEKIQLPFKDQRSLYDSSSITLPKNEMKKMKNLLLVPIEMLSGLTPIGLVSATPPTPISGTYTITSFTVLSSEVTDGILHRTIAVKFVTEGDVVGTVDYELRQTINTKTGKGTFRTVGKATGTILGRTGQSDYNGQGTYEGFDTSALKTQGIVWFTNGRDGWEGIHAMLAFDGTSLARGSWEGTVHYNQQETSQTTTDNHAP